MRTDLTGGQNDIAKMSGGCSGDFDLNGSDFETISQTDIEACQREFRTTGVEGCRRLLQVKQEEWKNIPLNVAVIGNSGVGKSSFINSIRCKYTLLSAIDYLH